VGGFHGYLSVCRFVGYRKRICSPYLNIVYHLQVFLWVFFVFPMSDERFEVVVHHRGEFAKNEWCKYVGGETTHWSCDPVVELQRCMKSSMGSGNG